MASFDPPQVLVLGGGGILGEAWMTAVLAGLHESTGFDARGCDGYVGTSAGSIVAAALTAGIEPHERLGELPEQPPVPAAELTEADRLDATRSGEAVRGAGPGVGLPCRDRGTGADAARCTRHDRVS